MIIRNNNTHSRRSFLSLALVSIFAHQNSWAKNLIQESDDTDTIIAQNLLGLISHSESATLIGRMYLDIYPTESNYSTLVRSIFRTKKERIHARRDSSFDLRNRLEIIRKKEFSNGDVASLEGWVLAKSEARICALTAIATIGEFDEMAGS